VQLTGTNRSIGLIARGPAAPHHRPRAAPNPCLGRVRPMRPPDTSLLPRHITRELARPGGHSEGPNTRSHPELGRENPQRRWYCTSRCGRVGRRQARQSPPTLPPHPLYAGHGQALGPTIAGWSSPVARQAHNLKVVGSNPTPATKLRRQVKDLAVFPFWGLCLEPASGSTVEARECVIVSESTS
jgi:hypothetical protein